MKLMLTMLIVCLSFTAFCQEEPEFGPVNVSTEKYQNRPVLIFSQQGNQYFINIRTNQGRVNYVAKLLGGKTQGGLTESTYSIYDEKGRKISALFRHTIGYDMFLKKQVNELVMLELIGKAEKETGIKAHLVSL